VHRDLKTPNLLVEKLGTEYRVKVAGTWGSPVECKAVVVGG
jgi:hypothetical protein